MQKRKVAIVLFNKKNNYKIQYGSWDTNQGINPWRVSPHATFCKLNNIKLSLNYNSSIILIISARFRVETGTWVSSVSSKTSSVFMNALIYNPFTK